MDCSTKLVSDGASTVTGLVAGVVARGGCELFKGYWGTVDRVRK